MMESQIDTLTRINTDDLVASFGWEHNRIGASILRLLFTRTARTFAKQMSEFDSCVGRQNLADASRATLHSHYVKDVRVHGTENIPKSGPALFLSNHPGMADTLSLFTSINRTDLKIIAVHRPFLVSLLNVTKQLIFVSDESSDRIRAVRQTSAHLRSGGSVLTFPAGEIEPDPGVHSGTLNSLKTWTDSAGVFIRFAPETRIVPVLVSGVIWKKAANHPLLNIKRGKKDKEKLAAAIQLLSMISRGTRPTTVHVQFAPSISHLEIGSSKPEALHEILLARMEGLINNPPVGYGMSAL